MATAELINPIHSDERSPTDPRPPQTRTSLYRKQLSLDVPDQRGVLSSSLPSPISKKELKFLRAVHQNEKNKRQLFKLSSSKSMDADSVDDGDAELEGLPPRSNSLSTSNAEQRMMRPRSASLFSSEGGSSKKKSKGLSRSRPSSARLGRSRSRSRADSFKPDEASMEKVELIMANIKTQLIQFSEEDLALQERLKNLTEGINVLITSYCRKLRPTQLNPVRSVSSGTPRKPGKAVHWKDMEMCADRASLSAQSSESEPNLLTSSNLLSVPRVMISESTSDTNILLTKREDNEMIEGIVTRHKVLKLNKLEVCRPSASTPPPICTIVIEDFDGQVRCPTPSSLADDEVFVL